MSYPARAEGLVIRIKPYCIYEILIKYLILRIHHKLAFHLFPRNNFMKYESRIRASSRQWIRLPRDTNSNAIHASLWRLFTYFIHPGPFNEIERYKAFNIEGIGDEDDGEALVKPPFVSRLTRPIYLTRYNVEHNKHLYENLDTIELWGIGSVPFASSWHRRVHEVHMGHNFQEAVRVRVGCVPTPVRQSTGGCNVAVRC